MPATILTSLLLWSALLAPAAGSDRARSVGLDRVIDWAIAPPAIRSCPLQELISWALPDADTEEEETGDGDSDGLATGTVWLLLPHPSEGLASAIRRDRGMTLRPSRSPILRC